MPPLPDPVRWHNELLVTPTSVEQLSLRSEALIQALPGRYQPYFWGVIHAQVVVDDLAAGVLTVRALDAVMRNGLHVSIDERAPLRLTIEPGDHRKVVVRLAVRQDASGDARPFVPCSGASANVLMGEDGLEIPFVRTRLALYTDQPPPLSLPDAGFPLCELRRDGASLRLTSFLPPTLQVGADSPLGRRCASIPQELRAEMRSVTDRPQVSALVGALPAFEAVLAARPHPLSLHVELCRLAGAVAVFRNHTQPPQFPPYDHEASAAAFDKLVRFVRGLADDTEFEAVRRCTFERDGIWFRLAADSGWTDAIAADSRRQMILAMETDAGDAAAQRWGDHCVIGTAGTVKALLARRVRGMARRRVSPGAALPSRRDVHLFRIAPDAESARPGEDLLVLADLPGLKDLPGAENLPGVRPAALHLYVVEPQQGEP